MKRIGILTLLALVWCTSTYGQVARDQAAQSAAPSVAAPDPAANDPGYLLGPEDVLGVFVWKEPDLSTTVMIRPDGKVSLPLVDEIHAAGKRPDEVRDMVAAALARYIDNPVVSVFVHEINNPKVSVLGEVRLPGRYLMRQRVTLLDAIALAGGFTEFAKRDSVAIVRNGPEGVTRIAVDLDGVLKGRSKRLPELRANDTIYVQ